MNQYFKKLQKDFLDIIKELNVVLFKEKYSHSLPSHIKLYIISNIYFNSTNTIESDFKDEEKEMIKIVLSDKNTIENFEFHMQIFSTPKKKLYMKKTILHFKNLPMINKLKEF